MNGRWSFITFLLAALFSAALPGCRGNSPEGGAKKPPVIGGVALATVREEIVPEEVEAVGTVRARNSAQLAARVSGTVTALLVREGDRVAKGRHLLTIEAGETSAGAAGARAGVEEALRGVEEARARKRLADATFDRYGRLFSEQAVTRQEFDGRQMEKDVATEGLARAEARLAQARETARAAATVAGYSRVVSPLTGVVTAKPVEVGMTVFPGTPLVTVEEEGHYRLDATLAEALAGNAHAGDRVRVVIDGIGEMDGRVSEVVPVADPASRTFTVKVELAARGLRSGTFGRAYFAVGNRPALLVPKAAVVERGALTSVWVAGKDNIVGMRLVKAGRTLGDRVEILSGLSSGERVAVGGVGKVVEGARVE
ncbi:MAG TPA: efflux RND transporter periplasmic adaptor subunit [Desulfuromonadaceae bacterium]